MKIISKVALITSLAIITSMPLQAHAAATIQGTPLVNLDPTNASVKITITNFPTKGGLYIQQCNEPVAGARPTACNTAAQLWISSDARASFAPTAEIIFKPQATYVAGGNRIDCTAVKCGIFVRFDHTVTMDANAEDQFIPLTFAAKSAMPLATQSISKKNIPSVLKAKKIVVLPVKTSVGEKVKYTTSGSCSIKGTTLRAKSAGTCTLTATAPAKADMYSAFEASYQIRVK